MDRATIKNELESLLNDIELNVRKIQARIDDPKDLFAKDVKLLQKIQGRLDLYSEMLRKQRIFMEELEIALEKDDKHEVNRICEIILVFSTMIREDSKDITVEILTGIAPENPNPPTLH